MKNSKVVIPHRLIESLWTDEEFYSKVLSVTKVTISKFPRCDQWCDSDGLHMAFALAGYSKDDINVAVVNNTLTIQSISQPDSIELSSSNKSLQQGIIHRGIARRKFCSKFEISSLFSAKDGICTMKDGLLEVIFPLKEDHNVYNLEFRS
jgi:HSP20 family molecular chaperone IbpA